MKISVSILNSNDRITDTVKLNNTCCDYPLLSSYHGTDIEYLDAYNEKGEKVKVLSIYIPG